MRTARFEPDHGQTHAPAPQTVLAEYCIASAAAGIEPTLHGGPDPFRRLTCVEEFRHIQEKDRPSGGKALARSPGVMAVSRRDSLSGRRIHADSQITRCLSDCSRPRWFY